VQFTLFAGPFILHHHLCLSSSDKNAIYHHYLNVPAHLLSLGKLK
jgi:hypothetical protein